MVKLFLDLLHWMIPFQRRVTLLSRMVVRQRCDDILSRAIDLQVGAVRRLDCQHDGLLLLAVRRLVPIDSFQVCVGHIGILAVVWVLF